MLRAFDSHDNRRLLHAVGRAETAASADITSLFPRMGASARTSMRRICTFAHRAVLLFPTTLDDAIDDFADLGLLVAAPIPSVLVRRRLCARYGLTHEACDVSVTRVRTPPTGVEVEVFLFPKAARSLDQRIIDTERAFGFEDHIALGVRPPDEQTLERVMTILQDDAGLAFEGGGYNPHEGAAGGTVLYFVGPAGLTEGRGFERFELYCRGDFSTILGRHPVDQDAVARVYSEWEGADPPRPSVEASTLIVAPAERGADADERADNGRTSV